jgi:Ca2+-binding EF-hand superfamily protein
MNIPRIQLECSFSRKELYNVYTKFKALSKISMTTFPDMMKDVGVERSIFMNGLKQLSLDNTDFLERIFNSVDRQKKGYLNWDEFFSALKLISSSDLKDKIDLFFQIVDSDGNGMFSYDEIKGICSMSMSKIKVFEDEN